MKVSMIYMASGFGKRYGTNKLITEFRGEPLYLHGLLSLQKAAKLLEKTEKINCQLILISQYERVLSGSVEFRKQSAFLMRTATRELQLLLNLAQRLPGIMQMHICILWQTSPVWQERP